MAVRKEKTGKLTTEHKTEFIWIKKEEITQPGFNPWACCHIIRTILDQSFPNLSSLKNHRGAHYKCRLSYNTYQMSVFLRMLTQFWEGTSESADPISCMSTEGTLSSKGKTVLSLKLFCSLASPKSLFKILSFILRDFYLIIGRRIFQISAGNSNV